MSRPRGPGLLFQTQNMDIHDEGFAVKKKKDSISKTLLKKIGGNRKALQDLSNSGLPFQTQNSNIHKEGSVVKKTNGSISKTSQKKPLQNLTYLDIHREGSTVKKICDSISVTSQKKAGGNRKALQDLSNSLSIRQEAARNKKHNVAEERCLHNQKQCAEARKAEMDQITYDEFLYDHGLLHADTMRQSKETEAFRGSPRRHLELEPIPELPISAQTDWFPSPIHLDSPPASASLFKIPEMKMSTLRSLEAELTLQNKSIEILSRGTAVQKTTDDDNNIFEECFLHNHEKCVASQKAHMDHKLHNEFLFEHGLLAPDAFVKTRETEVVRCSAILSRNSPPRSRYLELEEIPELPMAAALEDDWCPSPPIQSYSPSCYELPELVLKTD